MANNGEMDLPAVYIFRFQQMPVDVVLVFIECTDGKGVAAVFRPGGKYGKILDKRSFHVARIDRF